MSGMSDVFGERPARPDTAEFWRLSEIVLRLDGAMEAAATGAEKDQVWEARVTEHVELEALTYMAMQRAIRALGLRTRVDVALRSLDVAKLSGMYIDGFIAGCEFTKHD